MSRRCGENGEMCENGEEVDEEINMARNRDVKTSAGKGGKKWDDGILYTCKTDADFLVIGQPGIKNLRPKAGRRKDSCGIQHTCNSDAGTDHWMNKPYMQKGICRKGYTRRDVQNGICKTEYAGGRRSSGFHQSGCRNLRPMVEFQLIYLRVSGNRRQ